MKQLELGPEPATLLAFRNAGWHGYMQSYPFLNGPRPELDHEILAALDGAISIRCPSEGCAVERLSADELRPRAVVEDRIRSSLSLLGLSGKKADWTFGRFAWKIAEIPAGTRTILDIGCGNGVELLFLRAAAPDARIFSIDWQDGLEPGIADLAGSQFQVVNILDYLASTDERFDLIFSNHVIEHMYDPDAVCGALRRLLNPGGMMLAALPLDGVVDFCLSSLGDKGGVRSTLRLGAVDLGHPWKTTPADLRQTLLAAGFGRVRCVQRAGALNAAIAGEEVELAALTSRGMLIYRLIFGPLIWVAETLFGRNPPRWLVRLIYALERRVWFGGNNLKNIVAPEILAIAFNGSAGR